MRNIFIPFKIFLGIIFVLFCIMWIWTIKVKEEIFINDTIPSDTLQVDTFERISDDHFPIIRHEVE